MSRRGRGGNRRGVKDRQSFRPGGGQKWNGGPGDREGGGGRSIMHLARQKDSDYMGESSTGCFSGMRQGGRGAMARLGLPMGKNKNNRGRMDDGGPGWRKIIVIRGRTYGREWILDALEENIEQQIYPVHFRFDGPDVTFLLDDLDKVEAIKSYSRRIIHASSGNKVIINVIKAEPPFTEIPKEEVEKIRRCLGRRYNAHNAHLDLSNFQEDADLKFDEIPASLNRNQYMMCIAKLIGQNCPDVRSIDVSGNRLRFLDYFSTLSYRARNISHLNISNNQIEKLSELEKLKKWPVLEIDLDRNPVCNQFQSVESYTGAVHAIFNKVIKLDGVDVQPPITADIDFGLDIVKPKHVLKLPKFMPGFYANDSLKGVLEKFVVEYLGIYDDPNPSVSRQKLQPAYDESASFTMVIENIDRNARYDNDALYQEYRHNSHNISQMDRWANHRAKVISKGNLMVVAKLCSLPKTKHILETLLIDVSLMLPHMVCFSLQGLFRDGKDTESTDRDNLRFFVRSFIATPRGEGISIMNDVLLISPYSEEKAERYAAHLAEATAAASVPPPVAPGTPLAAPGTSNPVTPAGVSAVVSPVVPQQESKESLIARFMAASGLKPNWAEKCLTDNEWNFEKAGVMFTNVKASIPPDAFQ